MHRPQPGLRGLHDHLLVLARKAPQPCGQAGRQAGSAQSSSASVPPLLQTSYCVAASTSRTRARMPHACPQHSAHAADSTRADAPTAPSSRGRRHPRLPRRLHEHRDGADGGVCRRRPQGHLRRRLHPRQQCVLPARTAQRLRPSTHELGKRPPSKGPWRPACDAGGPGARACKLARSRARVQVLYISAIKEAVAA